jgi:hypothetical protein
MTDESERSFSRSESGGSDGAVRAQFDWASTAPSTAVIETLAVALDREGTTLDPLYESVDPDALDALVHSTGPSTNGDTVTVSFVFAEQQVTVHGTGEVIVRTADR